MWTFLRVMIHVVIVSMTLGSVHVDTKLGGLGMYLYFATACIIIESELIPTNWVFLNTKYINLCMQAYSESCCN